MLRSSISRRHFVQGIAASCVLPFAVGFKQLYADDPQDVPWLAEVQSPPQTLPPSEAKLRPLLIDDAGREITSREPWEQHRETLRRWWLDFLQMPPRTGEAPKFRVLAEDRDEGVLRQKIAYEVEPSIEVEAYLIQPLELDGPRPGVVALHSTTNVTIRQPAGIEGEPEKAFGLQLAKRGMVTISPRNFLWPAEGQPLSREAATGYLNRRPGSKGMAKMLHDSLVAMDLLASLPTVDTSRLGAVGHSLGAKEVLYLAAFDERVKAAVSSEGGVGTKFSNWHDPWYLGEAIRQPSFDHEHHELLALAAPRAFLLIGGESADGDRGWPFINAALPVYRFYGEPARLGFLNHRKGHSIPPEVLPRIYEWMTTYLAR